MLPTSRPVSNQEPCFISQRLLSSRKSTRSEISSVSPDIIEEFKNAIQDRNRRRILLLCTDLKDKNRSKHVVDSAVALRNAGHKVTVITTGFEEELYSENLSHIEIVECGKWMPKDIRGYLSNFLYIIRSLYSTLYMIYAFRDLQPKVSVVFCETCYSMIPIIKYFTNYRIVFFQYLFDLAQHRLPASQIKLKNTWFINYCLKQADVVLIPNNIFLDIYKRSLHNNIDPYVCEPYLNVRQLKKEKLLALNQVLQDVKKDTLIFLCLAEYHPRSNLELALDAFHLLLHSSDHASHQRLRLVIAGHAGRNRVDYVRQIAIRIHRLHLNSKVLLHPRPNKLHKKALLAGSLALLSCQEQGLWDRYVLEAMALGRPVIGADSGFTKEVLENGISGYVVPPTPENFAAAMSEIMHNIGKGEYIGRMAHCEFIKKYSLEMFGSRLNKILTDFYEQDKGKNSYPEISLEENSELFFG